MRRAILSKPSFAITVFWAAVAIVLPTLGRWMIDQGEMGAPFVTFFPAVILTALFLGWKPASITALCCGVVGNRIFRVQPVLWEADATDLVMAAFYFVTCTILILTGDTLRRTVRRLDAALQTEEILRRELSHRIKNVLSVTQSIASLTARQTPPDLFPKVFEGRLLALGRATEILARGELQTCSLLELISGAIGPFRSDENFSLGGTDCEIAKECCVPLVLVLHELCTNSVKYGALSLPMGKVALRWAEIQGEPQHIELLWVETGGPRVHAPATTGMGTRLMNAHPGLVQVDTEFRKEGVRCKIEIKNASSKE